ncbi:MAG: hypothetical protein IT276_16385 [Ignavibacteriaceae bacterium]|nr:hypothetical protein [Ignavibacterium sp.]MCC6256493.1 hypothetical protein [Ignavibacteriaceae bacterium]HRN27335.1 hypothetical protein [Ignavibacteriaceae bacterium]HRP93981.1 hypothetical protein [Ignavibacteriaceae bacterium]HRQ55223.1 hypothetical protein [Ignavibacteriaceae bacterium]
MKNILSAVLLSVILFAATSFSQVGVSINKLSPNDAAQYVKPLSTWFGTYFNSGTYYDAKVPALFGFKFNLVGMWSLVPDDQKTFKPDPKISGVGEVDPTATVFGNKSSYYLSSKGFYTYPAGLSLNSVPFGIYQVAGSFYNTELMVRFFPTVKFNDSKVGIFGFGLKHEISSHIPLLPVDISVQLLYNNFNFEFDDGDPVNFTKIKSNNIAFNVHASKSISVLTVYSGLQYESSSMDFNYYFEDSNNQYPVEGKKIINLKVDGDNNFRFTLGGAVKLGFFVINADVNLTKFTTFTTGLSLDF